MRIRHGLVMLGLIWRPMGQEQEIPSNAVFGDSLSDTGQLGGSTFTNTNPDGTPHRVWIDGVADRYDLPLTPSSVLTIPPSPPVPPANDVDQDAWSVGVGLSTDLAEGVRAGLDLN